MADGWIIVAKTKRMGGNPNFSDLEEWFAVAIADQSVALEVLKSRQKLDGADLLIAAEATKTFLDDYDVRGGQILSLWQTEK